MPAWSASLGDRLDRRPDADPRPPVSWPAGEERCVCDPRAAPVPATAKFEALVANYRKQSTSGV